MQIEIHITWKVLRVYQAFLVISKHLVFRWGALGGMLAPPRVPLVRLLPSLD